MQQDGDCAYRFKEFLFDPNTYEGIGWSTGDRGLFLSNLFYPNEVDVFSKATYKVQFRVPDGYNCPTAMSFTVKRSKILGSGPTIDSVVDLPNPQKSSVQVRNMGENRWAVELNIFLNRKTTNVYLQVPNYPMLEHSGYSVWLRKAGSQEASEDVPFNRDANAEAMDKLILGKDNCEDLLVAKQPTSTTNSFVAAGDYEIVLKKSSDDEGERIIRTYPFTIKPLRIPRMNPSTSVNSTVTSYSTLRLKLEPPSKWQSYGIGTAIKYNIDRTLSAKGVQPNWLLSDDEETDLLRTIEGQWHYASIPITTKGLQTFNTASDAIACDYICLELDHGLGIVDVQKTWPDGVEPPESVDVAYQTESGERGTVTLDAGNNWSDTIVMSNVENTVFTEQIVDGFRPLSWQIKGCLPMTTQELSIDLPISDDSQQARLDPESGRGFNDEKAIPYDDLLNLRELMQRSWVTLAITNREFKTKTYSAQKKWEIDTLNTDRPDSIKVVLQKRNDEAKRWDTVETKELNSGNGWAAEFSPVEDTGPNMDTQYRIRELDADGKTVWEKKDKDAPENKSFF